MGLADVQRVLARLYTDGALRERFFADPEATGATLGLSADEARLLAHLPARETRFYARSLQRKRRDQVAAVLPLTRRALNGAFEALFADYAETPSPSGPKKGRADAIAFAAFLARPPDAAPLVPSWVRELACYEAAWLQSTDPAFRCRVHCFRYPVGRIAHTLSLGGTAATPDGLAGSLPVSQGGHPPPPLVRGGGKAGGEVPRTTVAIWIRVSPRGRVYHRIFSLAPRLRHAPQRATG
jgi:hypothetical protein